MSVAWFVGFAVVAFAVVLTVALRRPRAILERALEEASAQVRAAGGRPLGAPSSLPFGQRGRAFELDGLELLVTASRPARGRLRLELHLPASPLPAVILSAEGGLERLGKELGLGREVQTGDAAFDAAVFIDTEERPGLVHELLYQAEVREPIRALIAEGFEVRLSLDGVRACREQLQHAGGAAEPLTSGIAALQRLLAHLPPFDVDELQARRLGAERDGYVWLSAIAGLQIAAVLFLAREQHTTLADEAHLLAFGGAGGLAWLAVAGLTLWRVIGRLRAARRLLTGAAAGVLVGLWVGAAVLGANQWRDTSAPRTLRVTVLEVLRPSKGAPSIVVPSWATPGETERLRVHRDVLRRSRGAELATLRVHEGAFGWEWVEVVALGPLARGAADAR